MVGSLHQPNDKLIALHLACGELRRRGALHLTLVAPYLCYLRQDAEFNPGEVISQQVIGAWIGSWFDQVITVDPHLHRIESLDEVIPDTEITVLHSTKPIAEFLSRVTTDPVLVGPDEESLQWVEALAHEGTWNTAVCTKNRRGDRELDLQLPNRDWADRHVVIVDDIVSTGSTLLALTRQLKEAGADPVDCMVVHALSLETDERTFHTAGLRHLWSTDSVPHPTNVVELTGLLADALTHPPEISDG